MYRSRYTLSELARLLNRSEDSIVREIETGSLRLYSSARRRRRGGSDVPSHISVGDLERWLGKDKARQLLDPAAKEVTIDQEPIEITHETLPGIRKIKTVGTVKKCLGCGRVLRITEFTKDATSKDWLSRMCKDCQTKKVRMKRK